MLKRRQDQPCQLSYELRGLDEVHRNREKTVLAGIVEIGATSIEFHSPIRVRNDALSDKSHTLEAFRRSNLLVPCPKPIVQTDMFMMLSHQVYLWHERYRWRHDQVLRETADILERERKRKRLMNKTGQKFITFLREGVTKKATISLLCESKNLHVRVDLYRDNIVTDETDS